MKVEGFVSVCEGPTMARSLKAFSVNVSGADLSYRKIRMLIGRALQIDLRPSNLLHGGEQLLWSDAINSEWFLAETQKLIVYCPEMVTLKIKLLSGGGKIRYDVAAGADLVVPASCSARNIRSTLAANYGVDASHFCHGGRKISLHGKEPHSYEPFLAQQGLDHGAKVFVLCQPGRTRARAADGGATPAFFSSFGAPAASAAEEEEAGAMSPPIARRKVALKDATAHYGVYRLAKGDLHVPLFSLTKQLANTFGLSTHKTRLLFGGLDLSHGHHSSTFHGAMVGSEFWVVEDESLMKEHPVQLTVIRPIGPKGAYVSEQYDANIGKRTTVLDLQSRLSKNLDMEHKMDVPRVFHGGTELKSYYSIFEKGLEPRARLDVIFALRKGVKEVTAGKTGTLDKTGTIRFLEDDLASEPAPASAPAPEPVRKAALTDDRGALTPPVTPSAVAAAAAAAPPSKHPGGSAGASTAAAAGSAGQQSSRSSQSLMGNDSNFVSRPLQHRVLDFGAVPASAQVVAPAAPASGPGPVPTFVGFVPRPKPALKSADDAIGTALPVGIPVVGSGTSWSFMHDERWLVYPAEVCKALEEAFVEGQHEFVFKDIVGEYCVTFDSCQNRDSPHSQTLLVLPDLVTSVRRDADSIMLLRWEAFDDKELSGVMAYETAVAQLVEKTFQSRAPRCTYKKDGVGHEVILSYTDQPHLDRNMSTMACRVLRRCVFDIDSKISMPFYDKAYGAIGSLQYIGPAKTSTGPRTHKRPLIAGVALSTAAGEHNGTDDSGYYFKCSRLHGVTCPASKILLHFETKPPSPPRSDFSAASFDYPLALGGPTAASTTSTSSSMAGCQFAAETSGAVQSAGPAPVGSPAMQEGGVGVVERAVERRHEGRVGVEQAVEQGSALGSGSPRIARLSSIATERRVDRVLSQSSQMQGSTAPQMQMQGTQRLNSDGKGSALAGPCMRRRPTISEITRNSTQQGPGSPMLPQLAQPTIPLSDDPHADPAMRRATDVDGNALLLKGMMEKRSQHKKFGTYNWRERLFEVSSETFQYFEVGGRTAAGVELRKVKGSFSTASISNVALCPDKAHHTHLIEITHGGEVLVIQFVDEHQQKHWHDTLTRISSARSTRDTLERGLRMPTDA